MMITSKMKIRTTLSKQTNNNKQSNGSSCRSWRILSVQRTISLLLILLLLVYTTIIFQSLIGLGKDDAVIASASSKNKHSKQARIVNTNSITTRFSSANHHIQERRRQQQQQQQQQQTKKRQNQKPKETELAVPGQADDVRLLPSPSAVTSSKVISDDSRNPKQQPQQRQQQDTSDHQKATDVIPSTDPGSSSPAAASEAAPQSLLLNVPFYVYEELLWLDDAIVVQDNHNNATTSPKVNNNKNISVEEWILHHQEIKHSEDWWFAKAALSHPQRTRDPSIAKIFVVPGLFNTLIHLVMNYNQRKYYHAKLCYNNICGLELLKYANDYLGRSIWFQRNHGNDHFLVASHYRSDWFHTRDNAPNLYNCHVIGMEDRQSNSNDRYHFPSTYVGQPCPLATVKKHDFAFIGDIVTPSPMFDHRRKICHWMMHTLEEVNQTSTATATDSPNNNNITMFTMPFCGAGPQCPTLAETRYGFHLRGDTNGANRLIDTILSGTVPIFTTARQYQVLPEWIDWRIMSMHINIRRTSKPLFLSNLGKILGISQEEYAEKLDHVNRNRDLVDWTTIIPFDQYMYALSCALWPLDEIKRRATSKIKTPYSAYVIPRPGHFRFPQIPRKPGPLPQDRINMTAASTSSEKVA